MQITNISRSELFYGKYDTRITIESSGVGWVRWYRTAAELQKRVVTEKKENSRFFRSKISQLTFHDINNLFDLKKFIEDRHPGNIIAFNQDTVHIYMNDGNVQIKEIVDYATANKLPIQCQQITIQHPNIIYLNEPKHKYRMYLRAKTHRVTDILQMKSEFADYLTTYSTTFYPCKALQKWLDPDAFYYTWYSKNVQHSHFIEYDDPAALTMLAMCFPSLVGKQYKLEPSSNRP